VSLRGLSDKLRYVIGIWFLVCSRLGEARRDRDSPRLCDMSPTVPVIVIDRTERALQKAKNRLTGAKVVLL
jgi:hypothetical protein